VPAGGVFVLHTSQATEALKGELPADGVQSMTFDHLSNGDDGLALCKMHAGAEPMMVEGSPDPFDVLDVVGEVKLPTTANGACWAVAGVPNASKHKTLVRKPTVAAGNPTAWSDPTASSQGVSDATSEWLVLKKNAHADADGGVCLAEHTCSPPPPPPPPAGTHEAAVALLTSGPCVALALSGKGAIAKWNVLLGPTDPLVAKVRCPGCLRARLGVDATRNVGSGSASAAAAFSEVKFFFPNTVVEPVPDSKEAKAYASETLVPTLTTGLVELCTVKPANPVEWLANWLIENNPNKPAVAAYE